MMAANVKMNNNCMYLFPDFIVYPPHLFFT